jgi:hypothetical protein
MAKIKTCGKDLSGRRFGRLIVLGDVDRSKNGSVIWICLCDCGNLTERVGSDLTRRHKNKTCADCQKLDFGEAATNLYFLQYKTGAKERALEFKLSLEEFINKISQNCYYCGDEPEYLGADMFKRYHGSIYANGIDRIDSKKGYSIKNTVPCCKFCNMAKLDLSKKDFLANVKRVVQFQNGFD